MKAKQRLAGLTAEVAALREEVRQLRARVDAQPVVGDSYVWESPTTTCAGVPSLMSYSWPSNGTSGAGG